MNFVLRADIIIIAACDTQLDDSCNGLESYSSASTVSLWHKSSSEQAVPNECARYFKITFSSKIWWLQQVHILYLYLVIIGILYMTLFIHNILDENFTCKLYLIELHNCVVLCIDMVWPFVTTQGPCIVIVIIIVHYQ